MALRVLTVTNMYPEPSRPAWGAFIKSQVDSLTAQGVEIDVMVIPGYRSKFEYLFAIVRLWRRCRSRNYDLIHAHYGLCGLVARMQFKLPVLVSYCGNDLYGHANARGQRTSTSLPLVWIHRALARFVTRVIVKSRASAAFVSAANPDVIPNGVDMTLFQPLSRARCRKELGLKQDAIYLLFPYDPVRPRKNFKLLDSAIDDLKQRYGIVAQPLIVHDVPNDRIPLYLNAADVMVLTSFWEGSPNAVKEAMACNTRAVSVDVGDVRELIAGHQGYEVSDFEVSHFADALARVLGTPEKTDIRASMQWLSSESIAARIIAIYTAMVTGAEASTRTLR